mmetsp:Transcript_3956/g.7076  ORF Transcript_3956/g.7076 Transcript_3956/m.7076 type:complete len:83 (+) Transcript_3956:178-426(+)
MQKQKVRRTPMKGMQYDIVTSQRCANSRKGGEFKMAFQPSTWLWSGTSYEDAVIANLTIIWYTSMSLCRVLPEWKFSASIAG